MFLIIVYNQRDFFLDFPANLIRENGNLYVRFFDVGQGDAALIVAPDGSDILIDGGPDGRIVEHLGRALLPTDRTLELVVLTHPHADHMVGLIEVFEHYKVGAVMMTGVNHSSTAYKEFLQKIKNKGIEVIYPKKGEKRIYGGAELQVLAPNENWENKKIIRDNLGEGGGLNETSIILLLDYADSEVLFMGDVGVETEKNIIRDMDIEADILKVGHHGSKYSTSAEFIAEIKPEYAIISSGAGNKYGHPHYRVLRTLSRAQVKIWRTDMDGSITAIGDGKNWEVQSSNQRESSCKIKIPVLAWLCK